MLLQGYGSGNCDAASDSPLPTLRSSISLKQNIKENGPSQNAVAAGKSTGEDGDVGILVTSATIVRSIKEMAATPISFLAATSEKEPDVQITMVQVVASMDWPEVTKYRALVSAQAHREEIIKDLFTVTQDPQKVTVYGGMIRELLIAFRRLTGQKPHRRTKEIIQRNARWSVHASMFLQLEWLLKNLRI